MRLSLVYVVAAVMMIIVMVVVVRVMMMVMRVVMVRGALRRRLRAYRKDRHCCAS